jgi:hypothetical protein
MGNKPVRNTRLVVSPNGLLRKHGSGQPVPNGWIIIQDKAIYHYGELLDIFQLVPFLQRDDYGITLEGGKFDQREKKN